MAGDPLKKVHSGEPLEIHAEAYNAFLDAARLARSQQSVGGDSQEFARNTTLAKVRNLTGASRTRFSVVGLSKPIVIPADNEAEFLRQTTFDGVTPTSTHENRFAVLLEPLAPNKIGAAAVAGVLPLKVHFTSYDHQCATIKAGDATQLASAASGPARILWHEEFPESTEPPDVTLWALVFLGSAAGEHFQLIRGVTTAAVNLASPAFQLTGVVAFEQLALAPDSPVWVAAPPGGVVLAEGDVVWATYHEAYATISVDEVEVQVDWVMLDTRGASTPPLRRFELTTGKFSTDATATAKWLDHDGAMVGEEVTLHDPEKLFAGRPADYVSGQPGFGGMALWRADLAEEEAQEPRWEIIELEGFARFVTAVYEPGESGGDPRKADGWFRFTGVYTTRDRWCRKPPAAVGEPLHWDDDVENPLVEPVVGDTVLMMLADADGFAGTPPSGWQGWEPTYIPVAVFERTAIVEVQAVSMGDPAGYPVPKTGDVFPGRRANEVGIHPADADFTSSCWITDLSGSATLPNKSKYLARFVGLYDPDPEGASDERPRYVIDRVIGRWVAGQTNAAVLNTASTFQLVNLSAAWGTPPPAPLTVNNLFGVSYALGERTIALEQIDGSWTNLPDPHRVYGGASDTFAETLFYKLWGHGAFNPTTHQPVYFEEFAADLAVHGPPVPRVLVRAFTDKGTGGGGGDYTAGCGIDADQMAAGVIEILVDPYGCILCDPTAGLKLKLDPDGCLDCGAEAGLNVKLAASGCLTCDTSVDGGLKVKVDPDGCLECNEENGLKVKVDPDGCLECGEDGLKVEVDPDGCIACPAEGNGLKLLIDPDGCLECGEDGLKATYTPGPGIVIAACTVSVNYGCGLATTLGVLHVNNIDLAGSGLVPEGVCGLAVNAGCGLEIVADAVRVKNSDLAGNGLGVEGVCGLKVNVGCGLEIVSDVVQVRTADLVGDGLETVGGSGQCAMQVKTGCGLELSSGAVRVKNADLAGAGLGTEGICALKVNVGCGLEIVSDAVQVKLKPSGGLICTTEGLATNIGVGCGLDFVGDTIFFDAPTVAGSGLGVEGICSLKVNTGCGLDIAGDAVVVDPADLAGDGLVLQGAGCALKVNTGCGLEIASDAVRVKVDPAGCIECHGTTGLKLKGDPVTIRSIKECELVIEGGELKLKLTYDVFNICAEAGAVNQVAECSVEVLDCEEAT